MTATILSIAARALVSRSSWRLANVAALGLPVQNGTSSLTAAGLVAAGLAAVGLVTVAATAGDDASAPWSPNVSPRANRAMSGWDFRVFTNPPGEGSSPREP